MRKLSFVLVAGFLALSGAGEPAGAVQVGVTSGAAATVSSSFQWAFSIGTSPLITDIGTLSGCTDQASCDNAVFPSFPDVLRGLAIGAAGETKGKAMMSHFYPTLTSDDLDFLWPVASAASYHYRIDLCQPTYGGFGDNFECGRYDDGSPADISNKIISFQCLGWGQSVDLLYWNHGTTFHLYVNGHAGDVSPSAAKPNFRSVSTPGFGGGPPCN